MSSKKTSNNSWKNGVMDGETREMKKSSGTFLGEVKRRLGVLSGHKTGCPRSQCFNQPFMSTQENAQTEPIGRSALSHSVASSNSEDALSPRPATATKVEHVKMPIPENHFVSLYASASELEFGYDDWVERTPADVKERKKLDQKDKKKSAHKHRKSHHGSKEHVKDQSSSATEKEFKTCYEETENMPSVNAKSENEKGEVLLSRSHQLHSSASLERSGSGSSGEKGGAALYEEAEVAEKKGDSLYEEAAPKEESLYEVLAEVQPVSMSSSKTSSQPASQSAYEILEETAKPGEAPKNSYEYSEDGEGSDGFPAGGLGLAHSGMLAKKALSWSKKDHSSIITVMKKSNSEVVRSQILSLLTSSQSEMEGVLSLNALAAGLQEHYELTKSVDLHWINAYLESVDTFNNAQSPENVMESLRLREKVTRDFQQAARTYASIIISELQAPNSLKTIPPTDMGGIAGGEKYVKNGILFKFAVDTCIRSGPKGDVWMYGGDHRDDEAAAKAAGYELGNLVNFGITYEFSVRLPLICLVDHLGFRMIAVSLLPIDKDSLVYGSNDGGRTVRARDTEINAVMERAGTWLGLAPHNIHNTQIYGPGDIEVHRGTDGRYYALDFARLMPPEAPALNDQGKAVEPRSVFYKFLRGEMVRHYAATTGKPLCSDAFTGWNLFEPNRKEHEFNLIEATEMLKLKRPAECARHLALLPQFQEFSEWYASFSAPGRRGHTVGSLQEAQNFLHRLQLDRWVHSFGINMRHMGRIRMQHPDRAVRTLILSSVVARCLKRMVRAEMRALVRSTKVGTLLSEWPFKNVVAQIHSLIQLRTEASDRFWNTELRAMIAQFFSDSLTAEERSPNFDLRKSIDPRFCTLLFFEALAVEIEPDTMSQFWANDGVEIFSFDITSLGLRQKCSVDAYFSTGMLAWMKAKDISDREAAIRLLRRAQLSFQTMMKITNSCAMSHTQSGNILTDLALRAARPEQKDIYFRDAMQEFNLSIDLRLLPITLNSYSTALKSFADFKETLGDSKHVAELRKLSKSMHDQFIQLSEDHAVSEKDSPCDRNARMMQDYLQSGE